MRRSGALVVGTLLFVLEIAAQEPVRSAPPTATPSHDTLVVRGRLVDAATGEPLRRGRVRLSGHQSTGYDLHWAAGDWMNPPELTTADEPAALRTRTQEASNEQAGKRDQPR